jgi:hypothetical protein
MRIPRPLFLGMALLGAAIPVAGQEPSPAPVRTVASCENERTLLSVAEGLGVNLAANRVNVWVFQWDWARVDFESWARNLQLGWHWDETQFGVNMFLHPYHGALYFDAARSNCLSYWESVPITFLGSWTWEFLAERARPSLNDFWMTGFGGAAMGEVLHRMAAAIIDERDTGSERIVREIGAMIVNPMNGLNRLVRGQWNDVGPNPVDRLPQSYMFRTAMGARRVREVGRGGEATYSPTLLVEINLGDVFSTPFEAPFDVITAFAQVSPDGGGANVLRATGRLYGTELTHADSWHRHALVINQRFDYVNNPVYHFGEQSFEGGIESRWRTGPGGLRFVTRFAGSVVMLGAIDALAVDAAGDTRLIDYGPGLGAILEASLERNGTRLVSIYNRARYLRSVSGARADHSMLFTGLDVTVPVTSDFGIGAYVSVDRRVSDYTEFPRDERSYVEARLYLTWTFDSRMGS